MPRRNIELKARLRDWDHATATALRLCGERHAVERQTDTYFRCSTGRLKLREIDGGAACLIAYARDNRAESRPSDYLLVAIPDPNALREALQRSLGILVVVRKERDIYLYQNVRIHLDRVDGLGEFVEFEAVMDDRATDESGHRQLDLLSRELALQPADVVAESYSDLILGDC